MPQNIGKLFEQDFQKSASENIMIERLPDAAQSFAGSNNLRFSRKNPFDFYLYAGRKYNLFCLELKSINGKSVSVEIEKNEKNSKVIHYHQRIGLLEKSKYPNITAGFIINFRELEQTYFIEINNFEMMMDELKKKSFNINDLLNYSPILIHQRKKRVRYTYDLQTFLDESNILL